MFSRRRMRIAVLAMGVMLAVSACGRAGAQEELPTLLIGGIPDQDVSLLEERFDGVADYLSAELDIPVAYQPSVDYAALVTAFSSGDITLGWFGGLTGVQARLETPGAEAVAQRPIDTEFHSVFIAHQSVEASSLTELAGLSFTFGSESSTSGHLMPRFFLSEAGVDPESAFSTVGYSGSHDTTWSLVEAGSYDAGVLNGSVWGRAVDEGQVDTNVVRVVERTPPYFDYHWVVHPDIDDIYGAGTVDALTEALLTMAAKGSEAQDVLRLFGAESFIETKSENYAAIEQVARSLGLIDG